MDIGYYNYYNDESRYSKLSSDSPRFIAQKYKEEKNSLKHIDKDPHQRKKLAVREFGVHKGSGTDDISSNYKTNLEVKRYLFKKYFGTDEIAYEKKWENPELYTMLENDYNAICFGTIANPKLNSIETDEDDDSQDEAIEKEKQKRKIDFQIKDVLADKEIALSDSDAFVISFNPYSYDIDIKSEFDKETENKIKVALNFSDVSKELFNYAFDNAYSLEPEAVDKMKAYHDIFNYTGYELGDLELKDGAFYTTDNKENILDVLKNNLEKDNTIDEAEAESTYDEISDILGGISKKGYNNTADLNLNLIYSKSSGFTIAGAAYSV